MLISMITNETKALTKEWLLTMLFRNSCSFNDLVENGCRVMIYGHDTADDIKMILDEMIAEGLIRRNTGLDYLYLLTDNGNFQLRKNTIVPLQTLLEDSKHLDAFVAANKNMCDITFLKKLSSDPAFTDPQPDAETIIIKEIRKLMRNGFTSLRELLIFIRGYIAEHLGFGDFSGFTP